MLSLMQCVLSELGTWCCTSTTADYKTVCRRVEREGISFLTISLSNFGKDFEKSLDQGFVGSNQFSGFHFSGGLPAFLQGFLRLVFSRETGRILDVPNIDAIYSVRQITLMWGKMEIPCSEARVRSAIQGYIKCEQEVRASDASLDDNTIQRFQRLGLLLWGDVFQSVDEDIYYGRLIPKHGPGATADKLKGNLKWVQREWPERLDKEFSFGDFLVPSVRHIGDISDVLTFLEPGDERPVRVVTVPKTLKTPRIIAIEPTAMQYAQQGIYAAIQKAIDLDQVARGLVGNASQVPNQDMARKGSRTGTLATLDLSEASDRVSNQHVRILLHHFPNLFRAVDACRSRKADVPDHGVIRLAKFASMGSALCFPMEAFVFCTVVFLGIENATMRPLTKADIRRYLGLVRVYGDDIIVPVEFVHAVVEALQTFGFVVNSNKSFWNGKFRESCGKDFYEGNDVSIVRLRQDIPYRRQHVPQIVSLVSTRNQFYELGMWQTAAYIDSLLERIIPFPIVAETSVLLGRSSYLLRPDSYQDVDKWDSDLHYPLIKGMVVKAPIPASPLDGVPALLKCLASAEVRVNDLPLVNAGHLERAGRPLTVDIKQRLASPY
jgi:hypothetical protein